MSIRIHVYCKRGYQSSHDRIRTIESVDLGCFDVAAVPREGDYVEVFDGWAGSRVANVTFALSSNEIIVQISPDYTGEYADEVAQRSADVVE